MPNYSLVANTQFQNRSFDDLLKPLAMYTQEYNALEDALGELDTKASIWEGMANEESDPIAYAQYKRYADDLRSQAASLAQTGLNPLSRKSMLNLKRRYAAEIAPIEQAYANRKIQADEQRKALLQNPTLLLSRRADVTSLDDYLKNPQLGYESYSGALLTQQVGTAAAQIAKSLREYGNGKALDGFTKTWLQEHGYTAEEVWQAIHNPDSPKSSRILNSMVDNVMADSGIPQWADRGTLNQAYNYARQGLWQAVGQTQIQTYTDEAAKLEADFRNKKELARMAAEAAANSMPEVAADYQTRPVRTSTEMVEQMKAKGDWDEFKKYFYKTENGLWHMTSEGKKRYKAAADWFKHLPEDVKNGKLKNPYETPAEALTRANHLDKFGSREKPLYDGREFMDFVDKMGISSMADSKPGPEQSRVLDTFVAKANDTYDTNTATETIRRIHPEDYKDVMAVVKSLAKGNELTNNERIKEGNSYRFSEAKDKVDITKLKDSDIAYAQTVTGIHGNYLEVKMNDGTTLNIPQAYINKDRSGLIEGLNNYAAELEKEKQAGKQYVEDANGNIIPISLAIVRARNSGHKNFLSSLGAAKIKESEVEEGLYK